MPRTRGKTPGWAAVDLQLRHGEGVRAELDKDPYPPIQNTISPLRPCRNSARSRDLSVRPLPSVVMPSVGIATVTQKVEHEQPMDGRISGKNYKDAISNEDVQKLSFKKLKKRFSLADPSLIEDIVLAVDDDFDSACRILEEMYPCQSISSVDSGPSVKDLGNKKCILELQNELESTNVSKDSQISYVPDDSWYNKSKGLHLDFESSGEQLRDDGIVSIRNSLEQLKLIPMEPEWEEDDVYLSHRKDAIKLIRSAAQHSRMASNCFLKGDHYSAQQYSLRAREEWLAADNLHSKAAEEILSTNNHRNDMWKLDLHGLHASEAVKALQNHLTMIETQSSRHRSISPKRVTATSIMVGSSSSDSLTSMAKDSGSGVSSRQRPTTLQVITGRGIHSKGHAALPVAVRSFLDENGYRYDETRPGVITVRPKFHGGRFIPK
uniref:Smr domain-containing protein n=1 Tax=Kalanchoe fedtschenkoi TaxID=63787 RepID=A0A7N0R9E3_KALFE